MKKLILAILLSACPAFATTYYISNTSANPGLDTNNGTSAATPWLTLAHLNTITLNPNDTVDLICGSTFYEPFTVQGGTSGNPINFGVYGQCSVLNPARISGADLLSSFTAETVGSFTAYYATETTNPAVVFENYHRLLLAASKAAMVPGSYWFDSTNSRVYVRTTEDANPTVAPNLDVIEASVRQPFVIYGVSNWNFSNIQVDESTLNGIYVTGSVSNINIVYATTNSNVADGIYFYATTGQAQSNILIQSGVANYNGQIGVLKVNFGNNFIIDSYQAKYNAWDQTVMYTAGIRFVSDGTTDANRVTNSGISNSETSFNGINPDTGAVQPASNYAGYGVWCDTCGSGAYLTNNRNHDNVGPGSNIEYAGTTGPESMTGNVNWNNGIGMYLYRRSHNVLVKGNTNDNNGVNCEIAGEYGGTDTTVGMQNNVVENNICTNRVKSVSNNGVFQATFGAENSGGINTGNVYQNNSLGLAATSLGFFIEWGNAHYLTTYAAFDSAYGSSTNSIQTDPLLTSPTTNDYRLQAGSPAIGAGVGAVDLGGLRYGLRHYISTSGSDSNDGLTSSTPWLTVGKVNTYLATGAETGGDRFWFNGGNKFTDDYIQCLNVVTATATTTLQNTPPNCSGVPLNPITFESYGTGQAIFDGADPISVTWTQVGSTTTYSATVSTTPDKLFVDCANVDCPQFLPVPAGQGTYNAGTAYNFLDLVSYTDPSSGNTSNYIHGGLTQTTGVAPSNISSSWVNITNNNSGNLVKVYGTTTSGLANVEANAGSWYITGTTMYVHTYDGTSPSTHTLEGTHRPYGALLNGVNHVTVNNLNFEHYMKAGVLSQAYADMSAGGNYWTGEYNSITNSSCWNAGDMVWDSTPTQTSNHPNIMSGCFIMKTDGAPSTHLIRGPFISGNKVRTLDLIFGIQQLQSYDGGIIISGADGEGANNRELITYNDVTTTNGPGIVYGIDEITAYTNYPTRSYGGGVSYNIASNNQGNYFFVDVYGGRFHHNYGYNSYGECVQMGNTSRSQPGNRHEIDHNLCTNFTKSASQSLYNGFDCNTASAPQPLDGALQINNTIVNVWGSDFSVEGGCTNMSVHNGIFSQFSKQFPAYTLPNPYFLMYAVNPSYLAGVNYSNNFWQIGYPNGGNWYNINGGTSFKAYAPFFADWPDTSSVGGDPGFINPAVGNYALAPTSPAIGASNTSYPFASVDAGAIPYTQGTTWYVRPDGGNRYSTNITAGRCNGKADLPDPGSGVNQPCAFNDVRMLYQDGSYTYGTTFPSWGWVIAGGDTVIIRGSIGTGVSYRIGWNSQATYCDSTGCWGITGDQGASGMPPPPSGTPLQHTRIFGENYMACHSTSAKTQLHGGWAVGAVMALDGTSYVDIACLDLTDFSACGRQGQAVSCDSTQDFAENGLSFYSTTHNDTVADVRAHGLADSGFAGPTGNGIVIDHMEVTGNASSGWNTDPGDGTTGVGSLNISNFNISWNGCAEEYPIVDTLPYGDCRDDVYAGYGDGFGTTTAASPAPGWQILFNGGISSYNTQDGLDTLHVNGYASSVTIMNTIAFGNEGQQMKAGPTPTFLNNVIVGNCRALLQAIPGTPSTFNSGNMLGDTCRAGNTAVLTYANPSSPGTYQFNTMYSNGAVGLEIEYQVADEGSLNVFRFQDNEFLGFLNTDSGTNSNPIYSTSDLHMLSNAGGAFDHNAAYGYSSSWTCPNTSNGETNAICANPGLVDQTFHLYGYGIMQPATTSSAIYHQGVAITGIVADYLGATRSSTPTMGAYDNPYTAGPTSEFSISGKVKVTGSGK